MDQREERSAIDPGGKREERIVGSGPGSADERVLARGMNPIREQRDDDLAIGIDPEARPREPEMSDRARSGQGARARSGPPHILSG